MHLMDKQTHLDRSMKIKQWTLRDTSSHTRWKILNASSSIKRTRLNDDDSQTCIQSMPLIKDEETHPMVAPKFIYLLTCSSTEKLILGCFEKIELFRQLSPRII